MLGSRGKIDFRIITDQDKGFLFDVYASTREWEFQYTSWPKAERQLFLKSQYEAQDKTYKMRYLGAIYRIIQLDGVDIGRLILDRQDQQLLIIDFAILPQYQGRGIGSDILKSLINEAYGGKVPVRLHVNQNNTSAIQFYLRHGFKKTGVNGLHFAMEWKGDFSAREF